MKRTEKELIIDQRIALHKIEKYVHANQLDQIGEFFPGFLHFNRKDDLHIKYLNPKGIETYDLPLEYIQQNGEAFFKKYIHQETVDKIFPGFINFYNKNDAGRTYADCQKIIDPRKQEFYQVLTVTKIVKDLDGLMSMSMPIHELGPNMTKVKQLMGTDSFYETHFQKFQSLTNREKQVLSLIAIGKTNREIGDALFISQHTVRTHRNHIWAKLEINRLTDAIRIADAFGLIQ